MLGTHRDDHYIFLLQEKGLSEVMIDFSFFIQKGMSALFILPGQVHRYLESDKATEGWFLAVDAGLIPDVTTANSPIFTGDCLLAVQPTCSCFAYE